MKIQVTDAVSDLLRRAAAHGDAQVNRFLASADQDSVDWHLLKHAKALLQEHGEAPSLQAACSGSRLVLTAPFKRELAPEFRALLEQRRKGARQAEYDALVDDVTGNDRKAAAAAGTFLPSARLQMSQGVHVCVTMGVGYALGVTAGRSFGDVTPHLFGVVGLIIALILETSLFITRASIIPGGGRKYEALAEPEQFAARQRPAVPVEGGSFQTVPARGGAAAALPLEPKKHR